MDDIDDSLDAVAAGIAYRLYDGWGHSCPACYRQRYRTVPSHSGSKDNERRCSDLGPLTCSGRREVPIFVVFTAEETNSVRLYGIVDSSGEKEKVENLRGNIKEIKDMRNE